MSKTALLIFASFFAFIVSAYATVLQSVAEINEFLKSNSDKAAYDISGIVLAKDSGGSLILEDKTGRMFSYGKKSFGKVLPGDIVRLQGTAFVCTSSEPWVEADKIDILGKGTVPPPVDISLSDLNGRSDNYRHVRVTGTVLDISTDEIDPRYQIILLKDGETLIPVSCECPRQSLPANIVDAKVRLTGRYTRFIRGIRKFSGAYISLDKSLPIEIIEPAPQDPFAAPALEKLIYLTPKDVAALGRRSVRGQVLAVWNDNRLMIRETSGRIVNVELADGATHPACGESGVFVGYPTTDLYRINLSRARFRKEALPVVAEEPPEATTAEHLISHNWQIENKGLYHGRLLRLTGIVRGLPSEGNTERRMLLTCGPHTVPVDVSSLPLSAELPPLGSEISATGRCLLELDNWRSENDFPRIRGFVLVTRTPDDIVVLHLPPWWTPRRLLVVIGVLLAGLVGFFVWNRTLRALVERRSRQLHREQIQSERAEVKLLERSNLAVELHDAISQYLTAIALELRTVDEFAAAFPKKPRHHLSVASRTLASCRDELRNCLWDLRHNTLDLNDLAEAIRMTVSPHIGTAQLTVRFDVARRLLPENVAHAVLQIVRELASNAVRHGGATEIRIAGKLDGNTLRFSVRDNGCGFSPDDAPGMEEGHFGLLGVRERTEKFEGTMEIESTPGKGTRITASLLLEDENT